MLSTIRADFDEEDESVESLIPMTSVLVEANNDIDALSTPVGSVNEMPSPEPVSPPMLQRSPPSPEIKTLERAQQDLQLARKMAETNAAPAWKREELERKKAAAVKKARRSMSPEKRKDLVAEETTRKKAAATRVKSLQRQSDREVDEMMAVLAISQQRTVEAKREAIEAKHQTQLQAEEAEAKAKKVERLAKREAATSGVAGRKQRIAKQIMAAAKAHPSYSAPVKKGAALFMGVTQELTTLSGRMAKHAQQDIDAAKKFEDLNSAPAWKRDELARKMKAAERKALHSMSPERRKSIEAKKESRKRPTRFELRVSKGRWTATLKI
jgi:hypothetical protein